MEALPRPLEPLRVFNRIWYEIGYWRRPLLGIFIILVLVLTCYLVEYIIGSHAVWAPLEYVPPPLPPAPNMDAGGFPLKERPAVAMLFLIRRQMDTNTIWERWYRDAFDWIYSEGLEDPKVTPMENSSILRSYINWSPAFRQEAVAEFIPPSLKHALLPTPVECIWSKSQMCEYRLFLEAYTTFPEAQFFILSSHNSMPLKPFSHIYKALKTDRRIRTTLLSHNFAFGLPKTSTWRGEPREIVAERLRNTLWVLPKWASSWKGRANPDECWIWEPLVGMYGKGSGHRFTHSNCLEDFACFMVDCWDNSKECQNTGLTKHRIPFNWIWLDTSFLDRLLANPDNWFLRKVSDNVLVGPNNITLMDYFGNYFHSGYMNVTVPDHPYANESIPTIHGGSIYDLRAAYKEARVYGLRDDL